MPPTRSGASARSGNDDRTLRTLPRVHATGEVRDVVTLLVQPGSGARGPCAHVAHHERPFVRIELVDARRQVGELDPQARTLVVCHVGARSARATAWLHQQGHDVANLSGGMDAWEGAQRPVVR